MDAEAVVGAQCAADTYLRFVEDILRFAENVYRFAEVVFRCVDCVRQLIVHL